MEKVKILFIDDEPNIVMGLKRMLHPMRNDWDMYFAGSGPEALKMLENLQADIIISDMKMPQMDGAQLLSIVKTRYPGIIRIILSGYSEKEFIMKTSSSAHQFLAKPCKMETLKNTIQRLINLHNLVLNKEVKQKITGLSNLPSLPLLYKQLDEELNSNNVSIKKIGDIISQDITMTAKILQMVNSAFFGLPQKINDPIQAVNFLGMDTIKSLVLFHHLFSTFQNNSEVIELLQEIWQHSFKVAFGAKKIMEYRNESLKTLEKTFAAGLLHDVGKLVLIESDEYKSELIKLGKTSSFTLRTYEQKIFGADHSIIGGYLLGLWGLPDYMVETVAFHHSPAAVASEKFSILNVISLADTYFSDEEIDPEYINLIGIAEEYQDYIAVLKKIEGINYAQ